MFETPSRESTPKDQQTKPVKRFKLRNNSFCAVTSPHLGGLGGECNEVDFGNGLNEVRVKPGDKRHLIARDRREKTNGKIINKQCPMFNLQRLEKYLPAGTTATALSSFVGEERL